MYSTDGLSGFHRLAALADTLNRIVLADKKRICIPATTRGHRNFRYTPDGKQYQIKKASSPSSAAFEPHMTVRWI
jgi:hypothetical protein